ncbi:MAG TPA: hypothetical protein VK698_01375 [Kofleriaceae bacterium]|nr:hypothetical protein [Kofleriaceae bacterium]
MVIEIAAELARAVDGVDWDAGRVDDACQQLVRVSRRASAEQLAAALDLLVDRLARARLDDADGVAHVAMSGGTLVERGAPPRRLGEVLLAKIPPVFAAARRFADRCLVAMGPDSEEEDEHAEYDVVAYVDDRAIPRALFRDQLDADRPGAAALVHLKQWTLPAVASFTRDRELLRRAIGDAELGRAAHALRRSEASWLHALTGAQLDAPWLILFPVLGRGFRVVVDGVVSNFDLHALLAEALVPQGVPGTSNPPDVMAVLRGEASECRRNHVAGSWNLYGWRAAAHDLREPRHVPHALWVWGEGQPRDVADFDGEKTLLIGPAAFERSWNAGRTFSALRARVDLGEELPAGQVREILQRLVDAAA